MRPHMLIIPSLAVAGAIYSLLTQHAHRSVAATITARPPQQARADPPSSSSLACNEPVQVIRTDGGVTLTLPVGINPPAADPSQPGYNPIALQNVGLNVFDIFEVEPRDDAWATAMERSIQTQLTRDLGVLAPSATQVRVDCRWATCRLSAEADAASGDAVRATFTLAQYGDRTAFSHRSIENLAGGRQRVAAIVLFYDERDLMAQARAYSVKRRAFTDHVSASDPKYGAIVRAERLRKQ